MVDITFADFIILTLATLRLSHLVTADDIMRPFRERVKSPLWTCIYCFSAWAGAIVLFLWLIGLNGLVWILALSGGALALRAFTGFGLHD